jgi:hypothetical protein
MLYAVLFISSVAVAAEPHWPLAFESNAGQWRAEVRFVARGLAGTVALETEGAVLRPAQGGGDAVRMTFDRAQGPAEVVGLDALGQKAHYFIGSDPSRWHRDVTTFRRVIYRDIYPGIDALFHTGTSGELEYDFIVRPGSDPGTIGLRFDGARSVDLTEEGELLVRAGSRPIRMKAPVLYQVVDDATVQIAGDYRLTGERSVGFRIGDYDRSRELVIDPIVLGYSTFLGGSGADMASAIAIDADRNVYIAGHTTSADFPLHGGSPKATAGDRDAFVVKLNPAGDQILFSTFIGGSGNESLSPRIAIDSRGDIYLAGQTSSTDFPLTADALQSHFAGGASDAYLVKLSGDGSQLLFSTYFGGEAADPLNGMAIDPKRNVYIAGSTFSSQLPITPGAFQSTRRGPRDAWVAKLRLDPPAVIYATYLGGSDETFGSGLAVDAAGAAYLAARTLAADYPVTPGAAQTIFGGAGTGGLRTGDAVVTKLHPNGSSLVYSTYVGGASGEIATAIFVDRSGSAFLTGLTYSKNFPVTAGVFQSQHGGGDADNFVTKIAPEGDRFIFSTYLGGNNSEQANGIAVDRMGFVHVAGTTSSSDFPTTSDALSRARKGENDAFVSIMSHDASQLLYSTFLGGTAPAGAPQDNLFAVAVDDAGATWVVGETRSTDFPLTAGAVQPAHRGMEDVFITKFAALLDRPEGELRVIPVAGSTPGALGSFFKTSLQLHNPRSETIAGRFVFHPQGSPGKAGDPFFDYVIAAGETIAISDLLPAMGESGLGSLDLATAEGHMPVTMIRIYNDGGPAGTTGMSQEVILDREILHPGQTGVLIAPPSFAEARFNIGVRSLADGVSLTLTVRRSDGGVVHTAVRSYPPDYFEQRSAVEFVGVTLSGNDTVALHIESGSAVIYGATTDNITQDPSLQLARTVDSAPGESRILPVIGSTPGAFGSYFKTAVQFHNPGESRIAGRIVYHPQAAAGSAADPAMDYELGPGETIAFGDLLPSMGLSGLGSADIISTEGPLPLSVIRVFNDGGELGTTGLTEDQISLSDVLREGDESVLLAPSDPARARFNIGIRTVEEGATITATVRSAWGAVVREVTKSFPAIYFEQMPATVLLGVELEGNESIRLRVDAGGAILYGATTDNITQDPTMKVARRLP